MEDWLGSPELPKSLSGATAQVSKRALNQKRTRNRKAEGRHASSRTPESLDFYRTAPPETDRRARTFIDRLGGNPDTSFPTAAGGDKRRPF
jgi:hypothetical protein